MCGCFLKLPDELAQCRLKNASVTAQLQKVTTELNDIKIAVAFLEDSKNDEISRAQRKCREEMASMQHIMDGEVQRNVREKLILVQNYIQHFF